MGEAVRAGGVRVQGPHVQGHIIQEQESDACRPRCLLYLLIPALPPFGCGAPFTVPVRRRRVDVCGGRDDQTREWSRSSRNLHTSPRLWGLRDRHGICTRPNCNGPRAVRAGQSWLLDDGGVTAARTAAGRESARRIARHSATVAGGCSPQRGREATSVVWLRDRALRSLHDSR